MNTKALSPDTFRTQNVTELLEPQAMQATRTKERSTEQIDPQTKFAPISRETPRKRGVLLINMGGPPSLSAVDDFLTNIFEDREIIKLGPYDFMQKLIARRIVKKRAPITRSHYAEIGGGSPIVENTEAQAKKLEEAFLPEEVKVYVGMRYYKPYILEAVQQMRIDQIKELIVIPLYPQYAKATTGSSQTAFVKALKDAFFRPNYRIVKTFHDHPLYIQALKETLEETLKEHEIKPETADILFTAHSIPKSMADADPTYVKQIKRTIKLVMEQMPRMVNFLSFQSRSGPVKWLEPETMHAIKNIAQIREAVNLLVVPLSFVSENIETLYELDIELEEEAERLGITNFMRVPAIGTKDAFIRCLKDIAQTNFEQMNRI